jgi:hypothetical protein
MIGSNLVGCLMGSLAGAIDAERQSDIVDLAVSGY